LKTVRNPRPFVPIAVALAVGIAASLGPTEGGRVSAQQPPGPAGQSTPGPTYAPLAPTPAPFGSPTASPTPEPRGKHRRGGPSPAPAGTATPAPTATPTSPAFATLDGTWEVQLQFIDHTDYSYLVIAQQSTGAVTGTWRVGKTQFPFEGTYDGRLIRMLVKEPQGNVTMSGYVEGASDMVGIVDLGNGATQPTAFTAEHRAPNKGGPFKKTSY